MVKCKIYNEHGFTVLELLVAVGLLSIVTGLGVANLSTLQDSVSRSNFINQLEGDLRYIRSKAVAEGVRGVLSLANDGSSYSVGIDELPFNYGSGEADTTIFTRTISSRDAFVVSSNIIFDNRGFLTTSAGDLTTLAVQVNRDDTTFCSGSIYPVGFFIYSCPEDE